MMSVAQRPIYLHDSGHTVLPRKPIGCHVISDSLVHELDCIELMQHDSQGVKDRVRSRFRPQWKADVANESSAH